MIQAQSTTRKRWMSRQIAALSWAAILFVAGLIAVMSYGWPMNPWPSLLVAGALVIILDSFAVSDAFNLPLSLAGIVLLALALFGQQASAVLLACVSGLLIRNPHLLPNARSLGLRAVESGARALALALVLPLVGQLNLIWQVVILTISYGLGLQFARFVFVALWHSRVAAFSSLRSRLVNIVSIEIVPLPLAAVGAAIAAAFDSSLIALAAAGLVGSAVMVRRASVALGRQRQSMAELEQINAVSRAIIRAELDVNALCQLIYTEASKVVDTRNFRLGLFDGRMFELKVRVLDGEHQPPLTVDLDKHGGIMSWIQRTGRSLLVDDFEREMERLPARPTYQSDHPPRSGIYIPLLTGDAVLGVISIQSRIPSAFTNNDMRVLSLIADQAAIAIDKARAYSAARRRAAQLATIGEVSRQVTAILDLDRLLPSVVKRIRASFGYHQVSLFTFDPQSNELELRASTISPAEPFWHRRSRRFSTDFGIVGWVAKTGEPKLVNDVREEPAFIADSPGIAAELVVPMRVGKQMIGVLEIQSDRYDAFDENDFFVAQTLADQIGIAIDSANLFQAQQEEAWVLNALLQSAENFAGASTIEEMLDITVRLPALLLGCERVLCLLWNRDDQTWHLAAGWGLNDTEKSYLGTHVQEQTVAQLAAIRHAGESIILDPAMLEALCSSKLVPLCEYGDVLAMPLTARATTLGLLLLDRARTDDGWQQRQIMIANGIAGQAASAIESALLSQAEAARQHLEQEINLARDIQLSLLPERLPQFDGWDTSASWQLARQVGGDFYDFWHFHSGELNGQFGFVIADVSDKGVPAALFMALSRSLVRGAALDGTSPAQAMERANRWIMRDSHSFMFVTLFYGIINPETGDLRYTCAGHNPPLVYRAASKTVDQLRTPGIALGVIEDAVLGEAQTTLEPGDILVCYTDGVTEAVNTAMEEWGVERLVETIKTMQSHSSNEIINHIVHELALHTGDLPAFDDLTLVVIKRLQPTTVIEEPI